MKQEQEIFEELVKKHKLVLAVSDDEKIGFSMPEKDTVLNSIRSAYRATLYDDVDITSLNNLEREVVRIIEESPNVIWWARNKVMRDWYAIQGWQKGKIRPDFIVARKDAKGELELVYVLESKGEQLTGNKDTEYKNKVFERMNDMNGKIEQLKFRTTTVKLNNKFEFELVPQGQEEIQIRTKLNT
jgi:type III restriction enzyme